MKSLNILGQEFNQHSGAQPDKGAGLVRAGEELHEAFYAFCSKDDSNLVEELADVVLTLASLAAAHGLDLQGAIERKHAINMERRWQPHPTLLGAVKHVKESRNS